MGYKCMIFGSVVVHNAENLNASLSLSKDKFQPLLQRYVIAVNTCRFPQDGSNLPTRNAIRLFHTVLSLTPMKRVLGATCARHIVNAKFTPVL